MDNKTTSPIICVIGNPPYSRHSSNNGKAIKKLMAPYRVSPEVRRPGQGKALSDDYVKAIRWAEARIDSAGSGVLGYVTNHGYIDNPTFLDMREHLTCTFDTIFVLDLHGNANKKEVCPDGSPDKNVFDIRQGVAILIVAKAGDAEEDSKIASVFHGELWGVREEKYRTLLEGSLGELVTRKVQVSSPSFFLKPQRKEGRETYEEGFSVCALMPVNGSGVISARDKLVVSYTERELTDRIRAFSDPEVSDSSTRETFFPKVTQGKYPPGDSRGWKMPAARKALQREDWIKEIVPFAYRPLDTRYLLYRGDMVDWDRRDKMRHVLCKENISLAICRQGVGEGWSNVFLSCVVGDDSFLSTRSKERAYFCPLYLYPEEKSLIQSVRVNFDPKIYARICESAGLNGKVSSWGREGALCGTHGEDRPDEIKIIDYVYGVLHSPSYRNRCADFLKADYPRVPYPTSPAMFRYVSAKGEELRRLHLLADSAVRNTGYPFHGTGEGVVGTPYLEGDRVWVNDTQYFSDVASAVWDFPIGGYHPAQKWLKDRKGRVLSKDDVRHYQRILKVLSETGRIMQEIVL